MFDDDGRLVAYTGRYRDKVIELKARLVTICTLHASFLNTKINRMIT